MNLLGTLLHLFLRFGYAAVVFGVMAENAGIPLPGETILLAAGFFASQGHFDIFLVILFAGAVMGDNVVYFLGRKVARPFVHLHRYSFPSGHTLVATAAYGMAAYLLGELRPAFRRTAQWGAAVLIGVIGISRLAWAPTAYGCSGGLCGWFSYSLGHALLV